MTLNKHTRKEIAAKPLPAVEVSCKCRYSCGEIVNMKTKLFEDYHTLDHNEQATYLMGLLEVLDVQRRRHGTYNEAAESRWQTKVCYTLADGTGEFKRGDLSQDFNMNRMFSAFKEKYPDSQVKYKFYRKVFLKDFPKLSFKKPRSDTCKRCDFLNIQFKTHDAVESNKAKQQLELHHRKAERCINRAEKLLNLQYSTWQPKLYGSNGLRKSIPFA
ncbi:hypothetical protein J6590_037480 [Homalodisca vitripennis]|nr:hypothetical protein J6590_037480 [Homalodisca vitripennis]